MNCPETVIRLIVLAVLVLPLSRAISVEVHEYYPGERDGLMQLRDTVNSTLYLHGNWTGPPCHNNDSRWVGIVCFNSHIVEIVLEGIQLTGSIPPMCLQNITLLSRVSFRNNSIVGPLPNLTNLVKLKYISLSQNKFSGLIPGNYIGLPKLIEIQLQENSLHGYIPPFNQTTIKDFNVSYNHLEGPIPETSVLQSFPESAFDNNTNLCGRPLRKACPVSPAPAPATKKNDRALQVWIIALIAAAAVLVPLLVMLVFSCYYRRVHRKEARKKEQTVEGSAEWMENRTHSSRREDPERLVELQFFDKELPLFDMDELLRSSAEVMGKGKLGTTYKAMLESGSSVAVKRLRDMSELSKKEFVQQMQLLGKMNHENLVHIVSFYYSRDEKMIIYEFVSHGNLFDLLHETRGAGRQPLNWTRRLSIIKGIAKGLSYLHQSLPSHKVPHANLKSSNVLIHRLDDGTHQAKLTDFGFLPLLPSRNSFEALAIGKSPEFCEGKKLTHKADVYCFGIILLEIITGRVPGEMSQGNEGRIGDLSDWARMVVNNDWSTDILDVEILASKEGHDEMLKLTEIALECTNTTPEKRPKMIEVLRRIEEIEQESQENK